MASRALPWLAFASLLTAACGALAPQGDAPRTDAGTDAAGYPIPPAPAQPVLVISNARRLTFFTFVSRASPVASGTIDGTPWMDLNASSITYDARGRLYVALFQTLDSEQPSHVAVFERGATLPSRAVGGASIGKTYVTGVGVDAAGSVYVLRNEIDKSSPSIMVFDPSNDDAPARWIRGAATELVDSYGLGVAPDGTVYVGNGTGPPVLVFAPGADGDAAPMAHIGDPAQFSVPRAIALDGTGRVYVTVTKPHHAIVVYKDGAIERTIAGAEHANLFELLGLAATSDGRIYVGNNFDNDWDIHVFAPGAQGDVAPEAILPDVRGYGLAVAPSL